MRTVISASRRTDLPRWHMTKVMGWFTEGFVDVKNPFNQRVYRVSLDPADVHSIVWWSKDYSIYLQHHDFFRQFNQFFHFTINGYSDPALRFLEPGVSTSLDARLKQLGTLASLHGPQAMSWRFDPVVFWTGRDGAVVDNTGDFDNIARHVAEAGINRCTISIATWYGKCARRARRLGFPFVEPSPARRLVVARQLVAMARDHDITLHACCNSDLISRDICQGASCIDGQYLSVLFNEPASKARDTGQRESCTCTRSKDIGFYDEKCQHGCIYCYGNPA